MTTTDPWATTDHDPADHDIHAVSEAEPAELIFAARDQFLAKLGDSLTALTQARWHLAQLRGNELYDIDFADSDDGADSTDCSTTPAASSTGPPVSPCASSTTLAAGPSPNRQLLTKENVMTRTRSLKRTNVRTPARRTQCRPFTFRRTAITKHAS